MQKLWKLIQTVAALPLHLIRLIKPTKNSESTSNPTKNKTRLWLWLDDVRLPPQYWDIGRPSTTIVVVTTAQDAIKYLKTGLVTCISLDHDLGDEKEVGNGYQVACEIERLVNDNRIPMPEYYVHSQNPVGKANIEAAMESARRIDFYRRNNASSV